MGYIPGSQDVDSFLKQSLMSVKSAIKQINAQAGKFLAKGNYIAAEDLISVAKKVSEFEMELGSLRKRWQELKKGLKPKSQTKEKPLPLWKYYTPTLRILQDIGGTAQKETIERKMEERVSDLFPPTEMEIKGNRPRWSFMMRRALGAMEKEGFMQLLKKEWRITPSGRKAAESFDKKVQS